MVSTIKNNMPFKRNVKKARPFRRKTRFAKSTRGKVNKLSKDVKQLKSAIEKKSFDHSSPWQATTSSPSYIGLGPMDILEGTGPNERVGNKITAKSISVNMQLRIGDGLGTTFNDAYNQVRVIILKYNTDQPNNTPDLNDILQIDGSTSVEETMIAHYKRDSDVKFNILHDKVYDLYWRNASGYQPAVGSGGAPQLRQFSFSKKLNDKTIRYNASNEPLTNLLMMVVSDSGATTNPEICYTTRFYYTDL